MHNLLKRQCKRHLGTVNTLLGEWQPFLDAVNEAYMQSDTDRTMLERSLELSSLELLVANSTMRTLIESSADGIFAFNRECRFTVWNPAMEQLFGFNKWRVIGKYASDIFPSVNNTGIDHLFVDTLEGKTVTIDGWAPLESRTGERVYYEGQSSPLLTETGSISGGLAIIRNITRRKEAEEALQHQTRHDSLTNLPNRALLLEHIAEAKLVADQVGSVMALLMLDLDHFQEVNNTFGHQYGDQLLQQVGQRLCQAVGGAAIIARLGGDEFAIFLPAADEINARQIAQAISVVLEEPIQVEDNSLQVEASIGIALYPAHGADSLTLLRHADVAMYVAKKGHEGHALYDPQRDHYRPQRLALLGDLRKAIADNELCLYYQPKADLATGRVKSVEALLRWQHPTRGFIPPDQFIPLAEQTGLIEPLTHWVIETALQQCRCWLDSGITLAVAVNLSMWNLRDVSLPDTVAGLLAQYRIPARLLLCEITESAMMVDAAGILLVLQNLAALGLRIAIDDYGTGYASLAYLKQLPASELKIDRSFVQYLVTDQADQAIVQSTVILAHHLGMQVVAEGVEDQACWDLLTTFGCDMAQGYYLSRPVPAQELERWLSEQREPEVALR
jgi:diguanylate cyclase (GGDEF)-like protein/PAS domain S-box-containing protein